MNGFMISTQGRGTGHRCLRLLEATVARGVNVFPAYGLADGSTGIILVGSDDEDGCVARRRRRPPGNGPRAGDDRDRQSTRHGRSSLPPRGRRGRSRPRGGAGPRARNGSVALAADDAAALRAALGE